MGVFTSSLTLCLTLASVGINCLSIPETAAESPAKASLENRQAAAANWTGPYGDSNTPDTFTFLLALPNTIEYWYPIDAPDTFLGFSTFTQDGDGYTIHGTRQATNPPRIVYEWGSPIYCGTKSQYFTPEWAGTPYGLTVQPGNPCSGANNLDWLIVNYANQEFTFPWQLDEGSNPQGGPPRCRVLTEIPSSLTVNPSGLPVNAGLGGIYCSCLLDPPS
ncbi:hypothetical protein BDR22DRAFT_889187 [Usnea florida]